MANQWFRMYHEFATDPKIQMLSESDQRRYLMVLCLRCSNEHVTLHDEQVAFQLRISNDEWLKTKDVFIHNNLIENNNKPTAWDKRQYVSDSSTARVKAYRDKKKRECNVTVTPPDTDTDTEKKQKKKKTSGFIKPTIPEIKSYFEEKNYNLDADEFFNHYEANGWMRGKTKIKNWKACARTWLKNSNNNKPANEPAMPKEFKGWENE